LKIIGKLEKFIGKCVKISFLKTKYTIFARLFEEGIKFIIEK
jgi:hypothetical protein